MNGGRIMKNFSRLLSMVLAALLALTLVPAMAEQHPDSWIADRTIVIQAYVDDIGYTLPDDLMSTPVMQKIKELTGISLDIRYTPGDDDTSVMASQMAAGNIPDVILSYLNNSTRPEFPILLKAAKEGLFCDVTEFMKNSQVYSRYFEDGYLPVDARENIAFRKDLDGTYIIPLQIAAVDRSTEYNVNDVYVGGMYIRADIAEALSVEPNTIHTEDELYDLLVKIKEGNFTDDNGNAIYPLGPKYWGGSISALDYVCASYSLSPFQSDYGMIEDGKIVHEAETDYVYKKINFVRKLLSEDLMHPEFFTMDATRAEELCKSKGVAIIGEVHNYEDIIYSSEDWVPLGRMNDATGAHVSYTSGKGMYGCWSISSEAEKPEEIFRFFDWLSTYEGQLTALYGVEGLSYEMVNGYPVVTDEVQAKLDAGDSDWLINNVGASFGGAGCYFFTFVLTNKDAEEVFGEARPGAGKGTTYARAVELSEKYPYEIVKVSGLDASSYLSVVELADVKASMDLLNYDEMIVQAAFANSDDDVKAIVESFRAQLKAAGIERFYEYVDAVHAENPESIQIMKVPE